LTSTQDYRVDLDAYSGPLDLLLFLVRRDEIDLYNIPIARLTEQYLEYLQRLQRIDVNLAGEFLVMAATLLEIKSVLVAPRAPETPEDAAAAPTPGLALDSADPRYELVQQLLAYKRFKDAAFELDDRRQNWEARYARTPPRPPRSATADPSDIDRDYVDGADHGDDAPPDAAPDAAPVELDLEDISVVDLCDAFARILETLGQAPLQHQVVYDDTPISLHAEDILDRLAREGVLSLQQIFEGRGRSEAIGLFLAMLELVRQRKVRAIPEPGTEAIKLELRPPESDAVEAAGASGTSGGAGEGPRWINPATGQVDYEWPSEDARVRAERRAKMRAARAAKGAFGKPASGEEADEVIDVDGDGEPNEGAETSHGVSSVPVIPLDVTGVADSPKAMGGDEPEQPGDSAEAGDESTGEGGSPPDARRQDAANG
jgi:segregation and condensation protein A